MLQKDFYFKKYLLNLLFEKKKSFVCVNNYQIFHKNIKYNFFQH